MVLLTISRLQKVENGRSFLLIFGSGERITVTLVNIHMLYIMFLSSLEVINKWNRVGLAGLRWELFEKRTWRLGYWTRWCWRRNLRWVRLLNQTLGLHSEVICCCFEWRERWIAGVLLPNLRMVSSSPQLASFQSDASIKLEQSDRLAARLLDKWSVLSGSLSPRDTYFLAILRK